MEKLDILRQKSPRQFEEYIASILPNMGYKNIKLTSLTADSGYDISATKDNKKILFECKKYSENNKVGSRDVRIFADACRRMNADKGIFITTGYFTSTVAEEQRSRSIDIEFWNGKELIRQIKNLGEIKAFCIHCNKPIIGYYAKFDWKKNVARNMNYAVMKKLIYSMKEELVPANPRRCERCEFYFTCSSCQQEFDSRYERGTRYHNILYCNDCYLRRKKRNRLIWVICIPIIIICVSVGVYFLISVYNENPSIGLYTALGIFVLIVLIGEFLKDR